MRIAINTRLMLPNKMDGIGWFAAETTRRMVLSHPNDTFYFLFDRTPAAEFIYAPNVVPVVLCPQARHPVLWYMFFEWAVPIALRRYKADVYLSPDGMMPLHSAVPTLSVIHDLNFEHFNGNIRASHQAYMRHYYPRFARHATRIATVSEYSKQDICNTYGIEPSKVDVVYDGANSQYRQHTEAEKASVRKRFTAGRRYLLFVSTILKRKNLTNLLLAYDQARSAGHTDAMLLVVGKKAWWGQELAEAYQGMKHRNDVSFMGHTSAADLSALMSGADALVYPSYFEGFGIPVLEAMYAETAVIASNTTSIPEVGGEAVLYINPASVGDIAQAIAKVSDRQVREQLIAKGREQRKLYSWDRTASLLWDALVKTAQQ